MKKINLKFRNIKKYSVVLFFFLVATISYAQTHTGDLTLTSQTAIDAFNFTKVTGNLTIDESVANDITNLDGLSELTSINKNLFIISNASLTSLSGLDSLTEIGGGLTIFSNTSLPSLSGLASLTEIGGSLDIFSNASLTSLSGLDSLTNIGGGYLSIQNNNSLISLSGLASLTEIGGDLDIQNNNSLPSLSGLEMLDSIGGVLSITINPALTDFCAISSLIGDDKQITSGEYTVNTNGYNPPYTIIQNESLCSNADGGIFVGDLALTSQAAIDTFNYRGVTGNLAIQETIGGNITNLDSLESLIAIGGKLRIQTNSSLPSLSGLEMLDAIGDTLTITLNPALTDFCAISSLIGDDKQITSGEYTVNTNSYNPSYDLISNETFCSNLDGGIFVGDLTLDTQASIDVFRYRGIIGNLTINDALDGNITNLDSLRGLIEVRGDLDIQSNDSLTSLSGLGSLTDIGGYLHIQNNPSLTSLSGLGSLTEIGGYLIILSNPSLTSLNGLESLTEIGEFLNIGFNDSLMSLNGLDSLTDIGRNLTIRNNFSLTSLSGLASLTEIGGYLRIRFNPALTDFCAISSLIGDDKQITSGEYTVNTNGYNPPYTFIQNESLCSNADGGIFDGNLTLTSQAAIDTFNYRGVTGNLAIQETIGGNITNLDSLESLIAIGGELRIQTNSSLSSLSGLEMLVSIGNMLTITGNPALTDFCAISSLIGDDKQITSGEYTVNTNSYNPSYDLISNETFCSNADGGIFVGDLTLDTQASIDSFSYRGIIRNLTINDALDGNITNLDSLRGLIEVRGFLTIRNNDSLTSLSGLNAFTAIGGFLIIESNTSLMSLSGLEMLASIGDTLTITGNPALTDFCAISSLIGDDKQITSGEYSVTTNGYNPPYTLIDDENYCSNLDGGIFDGNLALTSQAAIDTFNYRGVTGNLTINDSINANITNLDSLRGLTGIGGFLTIQSNTSLTSLSGLESLTEIGGTYFNVLFNTSLMSLSGLDSLTEIGGNVDILSNTSLTSLSGLESLTRIGGNVDIFFNTSLTSLSGLDSLTRIGGNVDILSNTSLTSLSGLESLTEIGGYLTIQSNDSLTSLRGLETLNSIGDTLTLTGNRDLTDFCVISSLIGDDKQITMGEYSVTTNGYNPSFEEIQRSHRCSTNPPAVAATLQNVTTRSTVPFATINVAPAFSDPNRDSLTYTATSSDTAIVTVVVTDSTLTLTEVSTGMATITVTASDAFGLSVDTSFMVIITPNNPPVVENPLAAIERVSGTAFETIDLSATFSDPDGDALTYMVASSDASIVTAALNNTILTLMETGKGMATITVTASDAFGLSVDTSFMVTITNTAPTVATALTDVSIESGTAFETIDLSATFSDPNGDALTYTVASSDTAIVTAALNNTILTLTETGKGTATITVTASDGIASDSSAFMVTITNTAPTVATALTDVSIESGTAFAPIDLSATFSDPNGDVLTYMVASSDTAIVTAALNNTILTLTETGKGTATITVTASDGIASDSSAFMVTITNTTPVVATALTDVSIESGTAFETIDISATFSDPNGDTLTYMVASSDASIVTAALNNTILTLTETGKGTATITVTASDAFGLSVDTSFMVTITNTAPTVATALTDVSIESGTAFETIDLSATFSDPNGDALTYTVASSDTAIVTAALNNTILTLTETGKGTATITVTASDGIASDSSAFMVTITNTAPTVATALTDVSIESGTAFETIDLSATFSDPNGDALTYTVASSDTAIVTAALNNTILTLTETGKGMATITVTASDGIASDSSAFMVTITNTAPTVATALTDVSIESGTAFATIDLSATFSDPNGDALTYTVASSDAAIVTATLNNTTLTLMETGKGMATITVTASDGIASDSSAFMVTITNTAPTVATALTDVSIESGTAFATIDLSATFSDPNGDALTYTVASSDTAIVTATLNNTILTLTETSKGTATITVTATDGIASDSSAFMVTITNTAPTVATALTDVSIESGTAFETIDLSATFSDPNGDALTYTVASSDTAIVTAALNNTILTLTETGKGTATITVTASDAFGLSVDTSFMVTITNTTPTVATALTDVSIESGTAFATIDISATFSDPNGDALTYTVASSDAAIVTAALNNTILTLTETGKGTATITVTASDGIASDSSAFMVTITNTAPVVATALTDVSIESGTAFETIDLSATFSDPNGDALTYTVASSDAAIVTAALNNTTLTLMETGKGMATITVTASDAFGLSVDTSFMVTITNTAPTVATALTDVSIESGTAFETIDLSATFSDPNGDALTYTVASSDAAIVTAALNNTTLTLTETGTGTATSTATITVTATDAFGLSVDASFMVTITNNTAPTVATALTDVSIESGTAFETIDISATFSDPNGDALTYTVASSDAAIVTATLNNTTLTLTETGKGMATITVTASDAFGLSVDTSFMVTITNTAPTVATALTDVSIESGTAFETIDISATFSDPNGDALTYTVVSSDAAIVTATLNNTTLTLMETGKGMATITVTASDAFGLSVDTSFMVTITNTAPTVATALTDVSIESGTAFETIDISATFSDPNGDALTYTVVSSNTAIVTVALSNTTLTLTETGTGTATITVIATDGTAPVNSAFMVAITNNTAPTVATALTDVVIESGAGFETIDLSATFSDENGDALSYTAMSDNETVVTVSVSGDTLTLTETGTGTATITVTATDPGGLSVSDSVMITVEEGETALGIADTDILAVYPNPSSGLFQLSKRADVVRVYDMSGRLIYRGRKVEQLDLTNNSIGQYLVEVRVGKESGKYTVIKK